MLATDRSSKFWNNFTLLCLVLSVGVGGFLFYKLHNSRKDMAMMNAKIQTLLTPDQQIIAWKRHFVAMVFYQGVRQQDIQVVGADKKKVRLSSLISEPTLVFRYNVNDCGPCIDFGLIKLKKMAARIGVENVLVLAKCPSTRLIQMLQQQHEIETVTFYQADVLDTSAEKAGFPYFFVIDQNMTINNVLIPDKAYPYSTDLYLNTVEQHYFSTNASR